MITPKTWSIAFVLIFCALIAATAGALYIDSLHERIAELGQPAVTDAQESPAGASTDIQTAPIGEPERGESYTGVPSSADGS